MRKLLVALVVASIAMTACVKKPLEKVEVVAEKIQLQEEDVARICETGYIVIVEGKRVWAPGGSDTRWPIATTANEDEICNKKEAQ